MAAAAATETAPIHTTAYDYAVGWYDPPTSGSDQFVNLAMECTTHDFAEARRYCEDIGKQDLREKSGDQESDGGLEADVPAPLDERGHGYHLVWRELSEDDGSGLLCLYRVTVRPGWIVDVRIERLLRCFFIRPIMSPIDEVDYDSGDETYRPPPDEDCDSEDSDDDDDSEFETPVKHELKLACRRA